MKIYLLKLPIILFFLLVLCFGLSTRPVQANLNGPQASRTGAPGELTCATTDCHRSFALNSGPGTLNLTGLPADYSPNQQITLTVTLNQANRSRYGFQLTALDDQGRQAGTLTVTDSSRTQRITGVINGNLRQYIEHNSTGTIPNGTNQSSWTFRWTAPAQSVGRVTFYAAGNAANGDGQEFEDYIYTKNFSLQPVAPPQAVATVSAASFTPGALASETIAALFAAGGLTDSTVTATSVPLPTELNGVRVRIKDAQGTERDAPLFFVSPAQINFLAPLGTGNGAATITVLNNNTAVGAGTLTIETVSPGLFAANANGQGAPAAVLFRLKANGEQSIEPAAVLNQTTNTFEPAQIDLGAEGDQVFFIGFGTGFRGRSALAAVTCTMGGETARVDFAGAQGDLAGLDQTNILIPRSLIGRGLVNVVFTVDGKMANTVQLNIQ